MILVLVSSVIVVGIVSVAIGRWVKRKGEEMERRGGKGPQT